MANINMKKGTEAAKANKTLKRRGGFIWNFLDNTNEETEKKPGDPNFLFFCFSFIEIIYNIQANTRHTQESKTT